MPNDEEDKYIFPARHEVEILEDLVAKDRPRQSNMMPPCQGIGEAIMDSRIPRFEMIDGCIVDNLRLALADFT